MPELFRNFAIPSKIIVTEKISDTVSVDKKRHTNIADIEQLLRIVQSIPSQH